MKDLSRFSPEITEDSTKFLYHAKINKELADAVEAGSSTEEGAEESAKLAVREGRKQALNTFRDINDELVVDIESDSAVEDGKFFKPIERLKDDTSDRVRDLLLGNRPAARSLTQRFGISAYYRRFVMDVFNQAENAEHTIGDVDFALSTLDYTTNAFNNRLKYEARREHDYRSWRQWFHNSEKEKVIFDARSTVVTEVFSDIANQLNERKTNIESTFDDHAKRVSSEFEVMAPDEKAEFLDQVQQEIDSGIPPTNVLDPIYEDGIMENLNVYQRIEVYKKAKLDQGATNRNLESMSAGDDHIKAGYNTSRRALEQYTDDLELDTIRGNLNLGGADIKAKNLLEDADFLEELREYLNRHGSIDRNPQYFDQYSDDFGLDKHENFVAYCHVLQENDGDICNSIPANFKKKILSCLKWIEEQEQVNDADLKGFSTDFVTLDTGISAQLSEFTTLTTTLNGISDLSAATTVLSDINTRTSEIVQQVADFEDAKLKNKLSDDELGFLELKYANLKRLGTDVLPVLKKKYEDELNKFRTLDQEYNHFESIRVAYDAERTSLGGATRPIGIDAINYGGASRRGQRSETHVVRNQVALTNWDEVNKKLVQTEEKIADICSKTGGNAPTLGNFPFSFGSIDLNTVNADIQIIINDIAERGRTVKTNPNTPNDLFKNYLLREASKDQNKKLDEQLEENRQKSLNYLRAKKVGSAVTIKALPYQHGNPPTSTEVLRATTRRETLNDCIVLSNPVKGEGTVLYNGTLDCLIIVQNGQESGRVEVIVMPAPDNTDIARDGLPNGFDLGVNQQYTATPISIVAS